MQKNSKSKHSILKAVFLWAGIVHIIFIYQLIIAVPHKGLVWPAFGIIFFPQTLLVYFLPPTCDFSEQGVAVWRIIGKIVDAFPGSLLYGAIIVFILRMLRGIRPKTKKIK